MLLFHGGELGEIGVQQDRRFKAQAVCLTFSFAEDVHLTTDAGGQRHDVRFTQRIDRRVGDLRELLAEVVINDARLAGEYGKRGIVTIEPTASSPFSPSTRITESSSSAL